MDHNTQVLIYWIEILQECGIQCLDGMKNDGLESNCNIVWMEMRQTVFHDMNKISSAGRQK